MHAHIYMHEHMHEHMHGHMHEHMYEHTHEHMHEHLQKNMDSRPKQTSGIRRTCTRTVNGASQVVAGSQERSRAVTSGH